MSSYKLLSKNEYMPNLRVILDKEGNLVFSQIAKKMVEPTGKMVLIYLDENDPKNPLTLSFINKYESNAFPIICDENGVCYIPTEKIFKKINIDYSNGPIEFYLENMLNYGRETYHLVQSENTKKMNKRNNM